ncbi:hypothetical protein [Streptomyces sp. NBC_00847]|uniref:hypothetical protein n=1 Tax=Streptomyces sp. NBC_00847 TaxID=2975850 RepID=UPI00225E07F3|nr:hypothetical protein [Streptomyces sp. NBC_00847]MCX4885995.1 hypothetical protein [Streptomyces sp. NBC_00847]
MSDTAEQNTEETARQEEIAGLLPALSSLDKTAAELEQQAAAGKVTAGQIAVYETEAAHVRHLVNAAGVNTSEITDAEQEHRSVGDRGFTSRALDHATHPRHFEPTPDDAGSDKDRERDDEMEIEL